MTPEGNFDAVLSILDQARQAEMAAKIEAAAKDAAITAAMLTGIILGSIATLAFVILIWWAL